MSLQPSWPEWESGETLEIEEPHIIPEFRELNFFAGLLQQERDRRFSSTAKPEEVPGEWYTYENLDDWTNSN